MAGTLRPLKALDPTGEKARAVKARYVGVCRGCGAYTQPRNGKGDAYAYCKACHPSAIERRWTRERVLEAMGEWLDRYGRLPSSYDWSRTHARRRGGDALRRSEQEPDDALGRVERALYLTAAMTGMRQGELLALRWMDVDWLAHRVRVRRNYVRGRFGTPKSKRSTRSIPLADRVAREVEVLFQASSFQADEDLVFGHPHSGRPLDRSLLLKRFKAALARAGVREIRFHDLRHTFGTRMAAAGVPMRTLQEWMGHRDFKTTLIYADYAPSANEAEMVNDAFAPGLSTNLSTNLSESGSNSSQEEPGNRD